MKWPTAVLDLPAKWSSHKSKPVSIFRMGNPEPGRWPRHWRGSLMLGVVISIGVGLIVLLIGLQRSAALTGVLGAIALLLPVLAVFFWTMGRLRTELTNTDTTASKQVDQELRESEDLYRKLLGATFEAIVI